MFSLTSNRLCRSVLSLVLSAVVLTWGTIPPATQHAHTGGSDSAHRHDDCHEVSHHGSHDHHGDGEHHQHATVPKVSLLADYSLHLHWRLFGLEFSMPVPEEPADDTDGEGSIVPAIIRVMNEIKIVPVTQAGLSFGRVLSAAIRAPSADVVRSLEPIARPPNLLTSIPLCDSARLERSGVLLA